ncbi:MAG: site-specific integrase [Lachnospiraceae bacterium]|nr:site-specific integrase [Lachnospiraceae bacterium]
MSKKKRSVTLNELFGKYLSTKPTLKRSTLVNYTYNYSHYIKNTLGGEKVASLRYSDIKSFYSTLFQKGLSAGTISTVHTVLHPVLTLAVRDGLIRTNPAGGALADFKKADREQRMIKHALTIREQKLFIEFLRNDPGYGHWLPIMTFFLGTGCRIGEVIGLTWSDIDFESSTISINHNTLYRTDGTGHMVLSITTPKTYTGTRIIPLFNTVREALILEKKHQRDRGIKNHQVIDGYTDFIFLNRFGNIYLPMDINRAIKRIVIAANSYEAENAISEGRSPIVIRNFSAHNLRHTFCTRLCEVENNIKIVMSIMGHSDIKTTMNIYNELQQEKERQVYRDLEGRIMI